MMNVKKPESAGAKWRGIWVAWEESLALPKR